jgi:glucokinase
MYILLDIGGTNMRLATSYDKENLQEEKAFPTPQNFTQAIELIAEYVRKEDSAQTEKSICCGVPGVLNKDKKSLFSAPHLPDWNNKPLHDRLSEIIHGPVYMENDADLAGLGEAEKGAGKDFRIVAYVTVSTGVGGARIVDRRIDAYAWGFEPGHQYIDADASITGKESTLEQLVAGSGIQTRFGKEAKDIDDPKVWDELTKYLSYGLTNIIMLWSPDVLVLGGAIINSGKISVDKLKENLRNLVKVHPPDVEIRKSQLGDKAGLIGGLHYLKTVGQR